MPHPVGLTADSSDASPDLKPLWEQLVKATQCLSGQSCTVWLLICVSGTWEVFFLSSSNMTMKPKTSYS